MESLPRKISEKDTGITTVIAQADGMEKNKKGVAVGVHVVEL